MNNLNERKILALALGVAGFFTLNAIGLFAAIFLAEGVTVLTTIVGADILIIQKVVNDYFNAEDDFPPKPPNEE